MVGALFSIGVVGYTVQRFDYSKASSLLLKSLYPHRDKRVEIVSTLIDRGVPAIAYRIATRLCWATAGVVHDKAMTRSYAVDRLDVVGEPVSYSRLVLLSQVRVLIRIGGSTLEREDADVARVLGIEVTEHDLPEMT